MMRRLFEKSGVDYTQWRALMRAYRLIDLGPLLGEHGSREALRAVVGLAFVIVSFTLLGSGSALIVWLAKDPLLAAVVMATTTMWVVGMALLFRVASIVLPDDYAMIGYRPVSSRTYFAVRLAALVSDALEVAALSGWLPALAFMTRTDGSWRDGIAAAAAIIASALTTAFGIVAVCAWLLRFVRPAKLQRALQYAQTLCGLGISLAYMGVWMVFVDRGRAALGSTVGVVFPRDAPMLLIPGTWFGAYIEIGRGHAGRFEIAAAIVSIAVLLTLGTVLRGKLSTGYAVKVAQLAIDVPAPASADATGGSWLSGERRAVALLMLGQFRGDMAVQTSVVMSLLMNGFVLALTGGMIGLPDDPFVTAGGDFAQFVAFLIPQNVLQSLSVSAAYEASWPFFASPARRADLVAAGRDVVAVCLLGPLLLVLGGLYVYAFRNVVHALVHLAVTSLIAYNLLQLGAILSPSVLFSRPIGKRAGASWTGVLAVASVGAGIGASMIFRLVAYRSLVATLLGLIALGGVTAGLNRVTRWRVTDTGSAAAYAG